MSALAPNIRSWINKPSASIPSPPEWVRSHMVGRVDANGTFLINTRCGKEEVQARVLVGHLVFERYGVAYARWPAEAREFSAALDAAEERFASLQKPEQKEAAKRRHEKRRSRPKSKASAPKSQGLQLHRVSPIKGAQPSIEWVQLDRLLVDDAYQRSIDTGPSRTLIQRIGRNWDWSLCVPLMVSRRPEGLYVIDGQHRLEGARLRSDVYQLPCCITTYEGPAEEAAMFVAANRFRRAMNRLDIFHAALPAGDVEACTIKRLVEEAGFTVARKTGSQSWAPGEVAFTAAIGSVLRKSGEKIIRQTLKAMAESFAGQVLISGGAIFSAVTRILANPPERFHSERLFAALRRYDAKGWASFLDGQDGGTDRASAMREALLMAYDETPAESPAGSE